MIPMVLSLFLFGFDFYELHILFPSEDKKKDNVIISLCIVIIVAVLSKGGFYSEGTDAVVISLNRQTLFFFCA